MRYLTLATDYDGTLAEDGQVSEATMAALARLRRSGRKLVLVTGRELPELLQVFPGLETFDWVVAENGALLYRPHDRLEQTLAAAPPEKLVEELRRRGVERVSVGRSIVATWRPYETTALEVLRDLGLEYRIVFNKDAVMLLPAGVTKASGLRHVLDAAGLSWHNVVGIGDAENDHAFLERCECSVAVANGIGSLRERVDLVTRGSRGTGVAELIDQILRDDLASLDPRLRRHHVLLGTRDGGEEVRISPYGTNLLIAGSSGSGKSTLATGVIERLLSGGYRVCVIDPEGDYPAVKGMVVLGTPGQPPIIEEVVKLIERPGPSPVVNLVGVSAADRPRVFSALFLRLHELRSSIGQPHWIVIDEAHHVLPADWEPGWFTLPEFLDRIVLVTLDPASLAKQIVAAVDVVVGVGDAAQDALQQFAKLRQRRLPVVDKTPLESGRVLVWRPSAEEEPFAMTVAPGSAAVHRHLRKYAEGDLGEDRSFYFRGAELKLNLRAYNLTMFNHLAEGIDDETWLYHLRRHDYSTWFRNGVKDEDLAEAAAEIESDRHLSASESRLRIIAIVTERYTLPAAQEILAK